MKKNIILLFCFLLVTYYSTAQDPAIFDTTWYLYATSGETEEDPPRDADHCEIPLTIYFEQNNTFYGRDRCSEFTGNWSYDSETDFFFISNFNNLAVNPCENECIIDPTTGPGFPLFVEFLEEYSDVENFWISTTQDDDYQSMSMAAPAWDWLRFRDEPILSSPDLTKRTFTIYPNPTSNLLLFTATSGTPIEHLTIYSNTGKTIIKNNPSPSNSLDVSSLSNGIYFIEILSEKGKEIHKFIKQ